MSKKSSKTATSHKTMRKTEAPKVVTRDAVVTPLEVETLVAVAAAPMALTAAPSAAKPAAPDRTHVARLAFGRFVARGYVHGYHVEDWFAAEAELRAAR